MRFTAVIFVTLFSASCSSGPKLTPEQIALKDPETRGSVLSQIQIGTPRPTVEKLLGRPSSETVNMQGAQVSYTFGMDEMMEQMRPSRSASIGSTILGSLGSLAGLAGPAGGLAGGVGSSLIGAATSSSPADPMEAMNKVETFAITYQNNKVIAISRNHGGMGAMMQGMMGGAGAMGGGMDGAAGRGMLTVPDGFPRAIPLPTPTEQVLSPE